MYFTWDAGLVHAVSPLTPCYYPIIIVSALWFGLTGAMVTAAGAAGAYLLLTFHFSGGDELALVEAIFRQIIYLFLVALTSGYAMQTRKGQ